MPSYLNQKNERVIATSDTNQLNPQKVKIDTKEICNTVPEERSREEACTEESIFSLKSPENTIKVKPNVNPIRVDNQESENKQSISQLEDMIDVLIKEQQFLKNKIKNQEKILSNISNPETDIESSKVRLIAYSLIFTAKFEVTVFYTEEKQISDQKAICSKHYKTNDFPRKRGKFSKANSDKWKCSKHKT